MASFAVRTVTKLLNRKRPESLPGKMEKPEKIGEEEDISLNQRRKKGRSGEVGEIDKTEEEEDISVYPMF